MQRRRVMLAAGKKPRLPKEYQEVEYIKSSVTQYIDTRISTNYNYAVNIVANVLTPTNTPYALFGARIRINQEPWSKNVIAIFVDNRHAIRFDFGNIVNNAFNPISNGKHTFKIDKTGGYCDGQKIEDFSGAAFVDAEQTGNMIILGLCDIGSQSGIVSFNGVCYLYGCRIENQDNVVRDYIPCYRKSDNKPGMYDLSGSICPLTNSPFYINAGTGEFLVGPDVN